MANLDSPVGAMKHTTIHNVSIWAADLGGVRVNISDAQALLSEESTHGAAEQS